MDDRAERRTADAVRVGRERLGAAVWGVVYERPSKVPAWIPEAVSRYGFSRRAFLVALPAETPRQVPS